MWIADAARSLEIDRLSQTEFGLSASDLMERAGLAVLAAARELVPEGSRLVILCGRGHNGGDGLVVARHAHPKFDVSVLVAAREPDLADETRHQLQRLRESGVSPVFCDEETWAKRLDDLCLADLLIDGLLGTGAGGEVRGPVAEAIRAINRSGVPVLAIDVPSGIHCDTGEELGDSVWAVATVTFGLPKPFLFQGRGMEHSGYWTVADIGFPRPLLEEPTEARLLDAGWVGALLPERMRSSHKGDNGTVLIVAGSHSMRGAAALAAKAALRAGAGLVTVAAIESVCDTVMAVAPEATLLPLPERSGVVDPSAADLVLARQGGVDAALFGPGLTAQDAVAEFLHRVFAAWERPACLDADALNVMAQGVKPPESDCVMTPHPGEMARLLNTTVAEVQADRFESVRNALRKFGKAVLLKGPFSLVGETFQPTLVNATGNSGMASAGMGDVLSGVVTTLMAQDLPAYFAAACGMYWHGSAGDECAATIGPVGYTALDLASALPAARVKITNTCDGCHSS